MRFFTCLVPAITSALFTPLVNARSQARDGLDYLSLVEHPTINTPSHRVHASSHFDVTFDLHKRKQRIRLTLEPNDNIITDDSQVVFLDSDGNPEKTESIQRHHHRVFKGASWVGLEDGTWDRVGWARIFMKQDGASPLFEGVFTVMHDHHHLMLQSKYSQTRGDRDPELEDTSSEYMIVFRDSDIGRQYHSDLKRSQSDKRTCSADKLDFNADPNHPIFNPPVKRDVSNWGSMSLDSLFGLTKRQSGGDTAGYGGNAGAVNLRSTIGNTAGCPSTRKVALVGVATDCNYAKDFNSEQDIRENVISVVNSASEVYEHTFNISLGLRHVTVSKRDCPQSPPASTPWNVPCGESQPDITERLNLFSHWRSQQSDDNAYWTLMSTCKANSEVGLSWLGQLCINKVSGQGADSQNSSSQAVTGANVVMRTNTEWQVYAHESGHTFGAVHDCDANVCGQPGAVEKSECCPLSDKTCDADAKFIMNPTSAGGITRFSACTVGNICSAMGRNSIKTDCLSDNLNVPTITGSQCGNGIVEEGEDCDCGGEESCGNNKCCNPKTCKFINNAVCDDSNEDCCKDCQFASSDTVCRASTGPCDPEEKCTGDKSTCPKDNHTPDGDKCGDGDLTCASGQCTSRNLQCKTLMGGLLEGNDVSACDSSSCSLLCQSSNMAANSCSGMNQNFIDGTPCSGGGKCSNGVCTGASVGNEISDWVGDHKNIVIGVCVGVGGFIILLVAVSIIRRCRRPRQRKVPTVGPGMGAVPHPSQYRGWQGPPPGQWQGPRNMPPPYPPPAYGSTMAAQGRMPTMRYA